MRTEQCPFQLFTLQTSLLVCTCQCALRLAYEKEATKWYTAKGRAMACWREGHLRYIQNGPFNCISIEVSSERQL